MKALSKTDLIQETKELITSIKRNYLLISANVFRIYEQWHGTADKWVDFYTQELELSKSQVSKMRQVGEFILANNMLKENVSYDKLYTSIVRHKGEDPKYILSEAQTWGDDDYKAAKKEECQNPKYITIELCENCNATKEKHA